MKKLIVLAGLALPLVACNSVTKPELVNAAGAIADAASLPACAALNTAIGAPALTQPCVAISGEVITFAESKALQTPSK